MLGPCWDPASKRAEASCIANRIAAAIVVEVGEHVPVLFIPLLYALRPPLQVVGSVGADIESCVIGPVEADVDQTAVAFSTQGKPAPLMTT